MPRCYLLTVCSGSSLDQHSNNVTLFNLVEQINLRPDAEPPAGTLIPVEVHAYFRCDAAEFGQDFELRFALVSLESGLESVSDVFSHRSTTPRYRTRTAGLPLPPVVGSYELRLDWRLRGASQFTRDAMCWPLQIVQAEARSSRVTH